jgi:hypothetical protein
MLVVTRGVENTPGSRFQLPLAYADFNHAISLFRNSYTRHVFPKTEVLCLYKIRQVWGRLKRITQQALKILTKGSALLSAWFVPNSVNKITEGACPDWKEIPMLLA